MSGVSNYGGHSSPIVPISMRVPTQNPVVEAGVTASKALVPGDIVGSVFSNNGTSIPVRVVENLGDVGEDGAEAYTAKHPGVQLVKLTSLGPLFSGAFDDRLPKIHPYIRSQTNYVVVNQRIEPEQFGKSFGYPATSIAPTFVTTGLWHASTVFEGGRELTYGGSVAVAEADNGNDLLGKRVLPTVNSGDSIGSCEIRTGVRYGLRASSVLDAFSTKEAALKAARAYATTEWDKVAVVRSRDSGGRRVFNIVELNIGGAPVAGVTNVGVDGAKTPTILAVYQGHVSDGVGVEFED